MNTEFQSGRPHRATDREYRTSDGQKIKRALERGLVPFLDDPAALRAELQRRIAERIKEHYPALTPADTPECEPPSEAGPARAE